MDLNKLTPEQFAQFFAQCVEKILQDPIQNFVRARGFIGLEPSPVQEVILKVIFRKTLDPKRILTVSMESTDADGGFILESRQMSETEIYQFLTDKPYALNGQAPVVINKINLICGRRCLAKDTEVLTPNGPKKIQHVKVGDLVYGYNSDGSVSPTRVRKVFDNGVMPVRTLTSHRREIVKATDDHVFLTERLYQTKEGLLATINKQKPVADIGRDDCLKRVFIKIPCGDVSVPYAYALGALLGDGCSTEGSKKILHISSKNSDVPREVARVLNAICEKAKSNNFTYYLRLSEPLPPLYYQWAWKRKAHEKKADLKIIDSWDRESCLKFLAGLIDTDGSVFVSSSDNSLCLQFGCQSKTIVESVQYLVYKLWHKKIPIRVDSRKKYKNGPVFYVGIKSNLLVKKIVQELNEFLQTPKKKLEGLDLESFSANNVLETKIGIRKSKNLTHINTYDLSIDNDTNLYVLANEGVITHNSGKTLLAAIIAIYCAITTNWKPYLRKTPFATALIMSHSREFSDEVLEVIKGLVEDSPVLQILVNSAAKQTASALNVKTPWIVDGAVEYSKVQIRVGAASSKTSRGIAACAILADEIAYWNLDENLKETDVKIIDAVSPAMKQFGDRAFFIKLSSPGIRQGVLYEEYKKSRGGDLTESYAVFKAPTWVMNPIIPEKEFADEVRLKPDTFDVEYRANFADSLSNFISPENIEMARIKGVKFLPPADDKSVRYFAAIDAAFKADRFTFSLVGVRENRVTQHVVMGWEGTRKAPVKASDVAIFIKNLTKNFPLAFIGADQYSFQPLKEIFDQHNLELKEYTFTPVFKKKIYFNLKKLVNSQQIDLLDHETQAKELKELIVEQTATGTIRIGHPAGGHDDYADALAISAMLATEGQTLTKFEFSTSNSVRSYGVQTDVAGRAFQAPSPDLLVLSGHLPSGTMDNAGSYGVDPMDGRFKLLTKFIEAEDPDDSDDAGGSFDFG